MDNYYLYIWLFKDMQIFTYVWGRNLISEPGELYIPVCAVRSRGCSAALTLVNKVVSIEDMGP